MWPSSDECRRRGRRTGAAGGTAAAAAAAAAVYSGEQKQAQPPFPSVCRLVEKYTMLIERHRQKQSGLTPPARRKPPTSAGGGGSGGVADDDGVTSLLTVADGSSDYSSLSKSAGPSSPALSDDAAAWNRLLMDDDGVGCGDGRVGGGDGDCGDDGGGDDVVADVDDDEDDDDDDVEDAEHYHHRQRQRQRRQHQHNKHQHEAPVSSLGDNDDRRFSCESLGSILPGSDEDDKSVGPDAGTMRPGNGGGRRAQQLPVVSRLEVSRTKVKRKRRKSWTGPVGRQSLGGGGPCRKGHSLDQGYETTHQQDFGIRHHVHPSLFRSFSGGGTVVVDGSPGGADGDGAPGARQFRTPSVVVSDHSEDPVSFSSMFTLDDFGEPEQRGDCTFNDSSSECSAASTWSAAGSVISVLDADYSVHTPERKISGCSTCSTFSVEDAQDFRSSRPKPKVSAN